ncbi:hypothetical protein EMIT0P43_20395 [Pseudomonas jessenii]
MPPVEARACLGFTRFVALNPLIRLISVCRSRPYTARSSGVSSLPRHLAPVLLCSRLFPCFYSTTVVDY